MEENVALDSTKKKKFLKSIKGIKKLIKKNDEKEVLENSVIEQTKEKKQRKKQERGLVYLSHIPHGFYEHQMTEYFKQFGGVTNARVIRSKRTGRSKGFAFVEFKEPSVAQIVAETMNNYLMGKRLLKAAYVPPEKQKRFAMRKNWNAVHNPGAEERLKHKKAFNAVKNENEELKRARKMLANLKKTKAKLAELGINYDFFMPVDVPLELINVKEEKDEKVTVKEETDIEEKPTKKQKKMSEKVTVKGETAIEEKPIKKGKKVEQQNDKQKSKDKKQVNKADPIKAEKEVKPKNKNITKTDKVQKVDKKEQEQKQKKLDVAGVKDVENFIKVQESDNDSDSSLEFDSDEYEKMLSDESEIDSDEESGDESDDDDDNEANDSESGEESVVDFPPVKPKAKVPLVLAPKKNVTTQKQEPLSKNAPVKRKPQQKAPVSTKKPKFEKQNKPIPVKKQFKKKK